MSVVLQLYRQQLAKLKSLPFEMGLPEEIERISNHINTLEREAKEKELASRWDGDLGAYDPPKDDIEHIDL
jgi:antitoxin component of RelBE/YafQ-DinJ toxin-antitoxin module